MPRPRHIVPLAAAAVLSALPAADSADARVRDLWATVNVCDTRKSPDMMGVRARMPGDGTRRRMYMRFTAQFRDDGKWERVSGRGRSPWLSAGSALFKNQELGYTFSFDAPDAGDSYLMRGLVQFQWRAKVSGKVVKRSHRYTTRGHSTPRADPRGFSAATCRIRGPAPD